MLLQKKEKEEMTKSKRKVKQEKRSLMDIIKQKGENNG